ncbi:MAG: hypothetical protein JF609_02135 [Verrucomicrobia bacterium]|nr:hypothetical protein [Verrucomicrobiota bacterium]
MQNEETFNAQHSIPNAQAVALVQVVGYQGAESFVKLRKALEVSTGVGPPLATAQIKNQKHEHDP